MTIGDIYGLLRRLGLSADNSGFFHISYAVYLAFQQPARCLLAERWQSAGFIRSLPSNMKPTVSA